jgi:uncharacterized protein (DUF1501 family)
MKSDRRMMLKAMGAAMAGAALKPAFAFTATPGEARLVIVILRGALDGLTAAPPYGDPAYAGLREQLAIGRPAASGGAHDLNGFFGLHPALSGFAARYAKGELAVFHAVASPYRERSHFDGQDLLENGTPVPHGAQDGWLNRALAALPGKARTVPGLAVGQNVPLILRGPAKVTSWAPDVLPAADSDTIARLMDLYADDKVLGPALAQGLSTTALLNESGVAGQDPKSMGGGGANPAKFASAVAKSVGTLLAAPDGPRVAVFELTGWDTHANEGAGEGVLALRLGALDAAIASLADTLGPLWRNTAVLAMTEFGRTAGANGTRGTDHGTGAATFLVGGAVKGGRVIADWPGLSQSQLYQGRDLAPTTDLRAICKGVLVEHLGLSPAVLAEQVFPGSAAVAPLGGLIKA